MFNDENYEVNKNISYNNHRKIYNYIPLLNGWEDTNNGHGTHVCGIASGMCINHPEYNISFLNNY